MLGQPADEVWMRRRFAVGAPAPPAPAPPDIVHMEPCAICCRVSSSFLRVGHFELYARRAKDGDATGLSELRALACEGEVCGAALAGASAGGATG